MRLTALIIMAVCLYALVGCASGMLPSAASSAPTKDKHHSSHWQDATILHAKQAVRYSAHTNKYYLIQVATIGDEPQGGYPVVYLTDGNAFFAPATSIAQMLHGRPNQPQAKSLLIVGIGYHTNRQFDLAQRSHDYTPPSQSYPPPRGEQTRWGGADDFSNFIEYELKPHLRKYWRINEQHQTLWGHSYGGLFALYELLNHPNHYTRYTLASPSLWWNNGRILADLDKAKNAQSIKNIQFALGEYELHEQNTQGQSVNRSRHLVARNMGQAQSVATTLKSTLTATDVSYTINHGYNHGLNAYPSLIQGITMAYEACLSDVRC